MARGCCSDPRCAFGQIADYFGVLKWSSLSSFGNNDLRELMVKGTGGVPGPGCSVRLTCASRPLIRLI
jgi:hypothetical protein